MATVIMKTAVLLSVLVLSLAEENRQKWSIHTKLDVPVTLECEDSLNKTQVLPTHKIIWTKKDHADPIENDDVYTLTDANMTLNFTVTDETSGIYFCHVTYTNDTLVGIIVKGVNVGVHEYDDFLDEYRKNLVVGAIAAGSVFFLVVSLGLLNNFQYRSEEQLEKRRRRKADRLHREQEGVAYNGYDNRGMALEERPAKNENIIIYTGEQYYNGKTQF